MPWGEKVRWVPVGKDKFQLDKWLDGLFLALEDESEMFCIGTPEGAFKTRTVKRQDPEKSSDGVFFNSWSPLDAETERRQARERNKNTI